MFNRLYEYIKKLMKENYKSILVLASLYLVLMWPVNYYITTGGGTIDIQNRVKIEEEYSSKGSLHLAYVSELEGNVATYLLSFFMKNWQRVDSSLYKVSEDEDRETISFRNHLQLKESIDSAIQVAYQKAGKKFEVCDTHLYIIYVSKKSQMKLKPGDEILAVAEEKVTDLEKMRKIISQYDVGDEVLFTIKRGKKEKKVKVKVYQENGQKLVGISIQKTLDYKTNPSIQLSFKKSESGPSGGMMLSLDIYNKLVKEDITKGYTIVGTGTIDSDGNIGEIGGVEYKLMGAIKKKADIFLVPKGKNYEDVIKEKKDKNYNIKIIGVKDMDELLGKLKQLPQKREDKK